LSTTATRTNVVVFYSPHRNLRLTRVPEDEVIDGRNKVRKIKGTSYQFDNNFLEVREGQDVIEDGTDEDGRPVEQDAVTWLRTHRLRGETQPGGFDEYREPAPASSETLLVVQEAILNRDLDRLGELLEEERNGHSREDVIEACQRAIAR
jgi:hypothetical protein